VKVEKVPLRDSSVAVWVKTSMSRSCAAYAFVDTPGREKDALDMICIFVSMHLN